jgi:hypothetical protein
MLELPSDRAKSLKLSSFIYTVHISLSKEVKREDWMLELPSDRAKSFGLGPRMFSRKGASETGGDRYVPVPL